MNPGHNALPETACRCLLHCFFATKCRWIFLAIPLFFLDVQSGNNPPPDVMGIIANNLSKAGWSWGCVATVDRNGLTIWIADAHRGDGQRFVARADEKLTAFVELESAVRACGELC
jgi:hypothetical protein